MEKKLKIAIAVMFAALFGAFIALLKIKDVQAIGPAGTSVGLATVNGRAHDLLNQLTAQLPIGAELWDKLSDLMLLAAFAMAGLFGLVGFIRLIRRKSLVEVGREIIGLGVAYLLAGVVYVAFEIWVVNYRPVLEAGETFPEASFPSSHTVLACVVFATAVVAFGRLLKNHIVFARLLQVLAILMLLVAIVSRMLAGVHWITDIFAGILVSLAITFLYSAMATEPEESR